VRLVAALAVDGLRHPELNEYDSLARALVNGQGFVYVHMGVLYHSYAPPLYPWICAASYWLTRSIVPVMLLQIVAGSLLAVVAAATAARLFGGWVAAAATGVLVAFHPGLVFYNAAKAHPLTFDALFFAAALWQAFRLVDRPTVRRALEFGVIVGLGALSRATIVIFLPMAGVCLLFIIPRSRWPVAARNMVIAGAMAAAIIAPWTIRSSRIHHQFVFILTTDSEDFWRGNNPFATGHSYIDREHLVLQSLSASERADLIHQPDELAVARWYSTRAVAFIRQHPSAFVRLTLLKFFHFWWFAPQSGVLYPHRWLQLYEAYYVAALLLACVGVATVARRGHETILRACLIGGFLLGLSALQSLYYVEGRHRWAVEPMLLILSGGGTAALLDKGWRRFASEPAAR
jgi:4-amino-4-deoxy-L-arabinose transferase-like glycosyltransferase